MAIVFDENADFRIDYVQLRKEIGPGPWDDEPDRVEWRYRGLPCLITRNQFGSLCAYVACPPGHPWHGKPHEEIPASAHGGVNYSSACSGLVCHAPVAGESDAVWWIGFDAGHARDVTPLFDAMRRKRDPAFGALPGCSYKTVQYMTDKCEELAEQVLQAFLQVKHEPEP